jgi:hypothetical protein
MMRKSSRKRWKISCCLLKIIIKKKDKMKYTNDIEKARRKVLQTLHDLVKDANMGDKEQKEFVRELVISFLGVGKENGMENLMTDTLTKYINKEFPHLKEELDKLLVLL